MRQRILIITVAELQRLCCEQNLSDSVIALAYGVSNKTVFKRRKQYRIFPTPEQVSQRKSVGLIGKAKSLESNRKRAAAAFKGGRTISPGGYVLVFCPDHPSAASNGYVREHRLIAESMLGRHPSQDEVIHHINGDKQDNRPENLHICEQSEHSHIHAQARKQIGACR